MASFKKLAAPESSLGVIGVLAFIDGFLPWFTANVSVFGVNVPSANQSVDDWVTGIWGWLPLLILMAIGALAVQPAFGRPRRGYVLSIVLTALATLIMLYHIGSYQWTNSPFTNQTLGAGAVLGVFLGIAAIVASVWRYIKRDSLQTMAQRGPSTE